MKNLFRIASYVASIILSLFGMSCLPFQSIVMYYAPYLPDVNLNVSGLVRDRATTNAIQNIRLILLSGDTVTTNLSAADGSYSFSESVSAYSTVQIVAEDIDGSGNGGLYQSATNSISVGQSDLTVNTNIDLDH